MEVHPPEHPIHTWRDFFIHIATIVVGLLIAIALEQSVEALHRRHLLHQAEAKLHSELLGNQQTLAKDHQEMELLRKELLADTALVQAVEAHSPTLSDQHLGWSWNGLSSTAWDTARDSGAIALMSYDTAQAHDEIYRQTSFVNEQALVVFRDIFASAAPVQGGRKLRDLKPTELDTLLAASRQALVDLDYLQLLADGLDRMYRNANQELE